MADDNLICLRCGKPVGTGTLLDQFPEPPRPRTSMHRLYLLFELDFGDFPTPEMQEKVVDQETWAAFASERRCIECIHILKQREGGEDVD